VEIKKVPSPKSLEHKLQRVRLVLTLVFSTAYDDFRIDFYLGIRIIGYHSGKKVRVAVRKNPPKEKHVNASYSWGLYTNG
jgi:hypothetical protein